MRDYMPFQQGQFDDILPGLAVVDYYLEARKAFMEHEEAKANNEVARAEQQVSGEKIKLAIYATVKDKLAEHAPADPSALMLHLIAEYRQAVVTPHQLGQADLLHHIACKAVLPFCKFDEDAFIKACEKATVGSKEADKKYSGTRSTLSVKKKAWDEAVGKFKAGVFKETSIVFTGIEGTPEDRAWDRASEFVRVWRHRASMHSEPVTVECTSLRSYPDQGPMGDVKKRWAACYKMLDLKPTVAGNGFMARKFQ